MANLTISKILLSENSWGYHCERVINEKPTRESLLLLNLNVDRKINIKKIDGFLPVPKDIPQKIISKGYKEFLCFYDEMQLRAGIDYTKIKPLSLLGKGKEDFLCYIQDITKARDGVVLDSYPLSFDPTKVETIKTKSRKQQAKESGFYTACFLAIAIALFCFAIFAIGKFDGIAFLAGAASAICLCISYALADEPDTTLYIPHHPV